MRPVFIDVERLKEYSMMAYSWARTYFGFEPPETMEEIAAVDRRLSLGVDFIKLDDKLVMRHFETIMIWSPEELMFVTPVTSSEIEMVGCLDGRTNPLST